MGLLIELRAHRVTALLCDKIKAWATFSRSTEDTKDLILAKVYSWNKNMIAHHINDQQKRETKDHA